MCGVVDIVSVRTVIWVVWCCGHCFSADCDGVCGVVDIVSEWTVMGCVVLWTLFQCGL